MAEDITLIVGQLCAPVLPSDVFDLIKQALDQQDGVVARAAEQLGMRRTTLVEKMRKYGLSKEG